MRKLYLIIKLDLQWEAVQMLGWLRLMVAVWLANRRARIFAKAERRKVYRHNANEKVWNKWTERKENFNVCLMEKPILGKIKSKKQGEHTQEIWAITGFRQVFTVASDNEIITLARKIRYLPKRMTAGKMESKNSIFYKTAPRMTHGEAWGKYRRYLRGEFLIKHKDSFQ